MKMVSEKFERRKHLEKRTHEKCARSEPHADIGHLSHRHHIHARGAGS